MSLIGRFATVGGFTMGSRVLGLVRDVVFAALLGSGPVAEAFVVAFRLPNLFRRFLAEGAFSMAFVPLFARRLEKDGAASATDFAEEAYSGLFAVLFVMTLAAQLAMPWLILALAAGFSDDADKLSLAIDFSRIQFPYLLFISLMALMAGVLNSVGKFAAAAAAPILLNVITVAGMGLAWALDWSVGYALSWSVLIAGVAQFALVARAAARAGFRLKIRRPRWSPATKRLLVLGAPGALAAGVTQINIVIGTAVASFFDGAVVWLWNADRVYQLPLGVVGVAIGVVLLPELSRKSRAGDQAGVEATLSRSIEFALLLTLPATAALIAIPEEIVRLLFERGAFTAADSAETALAVALYAAGLPAYVLIKALAPAYFAEEDTVTPLTFAAASVVVNVGLCLGLAPVIGWSGVAIGTAAGAWVNTWLLWRGIRREGRLTLRAETRRRIGRICLASLCMAAGLALAAAALGQATADPLWRYPSILGLVLLGLALYAALALGLGAVSRSELRAALKRGG